MITEDAFESDNAARIPLPCTINHPHAAAPDLFENLVITEPPVAVAYDNLCERGIETVRLWFFPMKALLQETTHTESAADPRN